MSGGGLEPGTLAFSICPMPEAGQQPEQRAGWRLWGGWDQQEVQGKVPPPVTCPHLLVHLLALRNLLEMRSKQDLPLGQY